MPRTLLITCEHASFGLPPGIDLGLSDEILESHVSYDRGALEIAERLAALTGAPVHCGCLSRLVVDLNRREDNPEVILEVTSGIRVPGNVGLDAAAREARIATWHRPYRHAVRADAERIAASSHCLHLSLHAFDPTLDPAARAFDAGVLFDPERTPEREIAARIVECLRERGWDTRINEPYAGTPEGLTSWLRAQIPAARYTGIEIEASRGWVETTGAIDRFATSLKLAIDRA